MEFDTINKISDYLKKEFELNDKDVGEMLEEFLPNISLLIEKAAKNLENPAWDELRRAGHSIKGASANVGADHIASLGKELENAALSSDKDKTSELISQIRQSLENLKNQLS